jgi:hypothetical protein
MIFRICDSYVHKTFKNNDSPRRFFLAAPLVALLLLISCSTNPVDKIDQSNGTVFPYNDLVGMAPDTSGGFWGVSILTFFRINPSRPDSAGSIVKKFSHFGALFCSVFLDVANKPTLIYIGGIYRLMDNDRFDLIDELMDFGGFTYITPAIDPWRRCRYLIVHDDSMASVVEYTDDATAQRLVFTDTMHCAPISSETIKLSAYGAYTSILFKSDDDAVHIHTYCHDTLIENAMLFTPSDSASLIAFVQVDDCQYLLLDIGGSVSVRDSGNTSQTVSLQNETAMFKRTVRGSLMFQNVMTAPRSSYSTNWPAVYRSPHEAWLYYEGGVLKFTSHDYSFTSFRKMGSYNRFGVFCFGRDGSTIYFDEVTQKFVEVK